MNREISCKQICKIPQFWAKATNTAHHTFLERRYLRLVKNHFYVLPPEVSQQKGTTSWTIMI